MTPPNPSSHPPPSSPASLRRAACPEPAEGVASSLSLPLKILYTAFVLILVPIYTVHHGVANFLWFSNIALLTTTLALWLENRLLASMMTLAVLLPELAWNLDFFIRLIIGVHIIGMTDYMFDADLPLYLRALSLYHVILPPLLVWIVWHLGYDRRALAAQTLLGWAVLLIVYFFTDPADNINWAFGPGGDPQEAIHSGLYLLIVMALFPLIVYYPTHRALLWLTRRP